jgi:hypothetical protein
MTNILVQSLKLMIISLVLGLVILMSFFRIDIQYSSQHENDHFFIEWKV